MQAYCDLLNLQYHGICDVLQTISRSPSLSIEEGQRGRIVPEGLHEAQQRCKDMASALSATFQARLNVLRGSSAAGGHELGNARVI